MCCVVVYNYVVLFTVMLCCCLLLCCVVVYNCVVLCCLQIGTVESLSRTLSDTSANTLEIQRYIYEPYSTIYVPLTVCIYMYIHLHAFLYF